MIVDCHTHIDLAGEDGGACEYLAAAEAVDLCIVLAAAEASSEEVNKTLSAYINKHREKMVGFALVDPSRDDIGPDKLRFLREQLGLEGAVLYCAGCGFHPADSRAMQFYEWAEDTGLAVFFHNGGNLQSEAILDYAQPLLLDEVARSFPRLKMVIGTMGIPFVEQTLSMIARHENVYADLTIKPSSVWQVYNLVVSAYESKVMDKLLFGSGFPQSSASECMETLLGFNKLLADTNLPTVPRGHIRDIIERDVAKLLGIKRLVPEHSYREI